jgi:hypothetical protein
VTRLMGAGLAVAFGLCVILGFLLRQSYEANGALEVKLAGAHAVIAQREADMKLSALEIAKLAGKVEQINATAAPVRERIISMPATTACVQTPAMQEAISGVRALLAPK